MEYVPGETLEASDHPRRDARPHARARLHLPDLQRRRSRAPAGRHPPRPPARQRARDRAGARQGRGLRHVTLPRNRRARHDGHRQPALHGAGAVPRQGGLRLRPLLARGHDVPDADGDAAVRHAVTGGHRPADDRRARLGAAAAEPENPESRQRRDPQGDGAGNHGDATSGPGICSTTCWQLGLRRCARPYGHPPRRRPTRPRSSSTASARARRPRPVSAGTAASRCTRAPIAARSAEKRSRRPGCWRAAPAPRASGFGLRAPCTGPAASAGVLRSQAALFLRGARHVLRHWQDLDERDLRGVARGEDPHRVARHPLRHRRLRGCALLQDAEGIGRLPPRRSHRPPHQFRQDLPDGLAAGPAGLDEGDSRHHPRQRARRLLHPPDHLPRLPRARREPPALPCRGRDPGLGVERLPRPGRAGQGRGRLRELVEPHGAQHVPGAREGHGQLRQRRADQDGGGARRLRRRDRARRQRVRERGQRPEPVHGAERRHLHAGIDLVDPARGSPATPS